MAFQKAKIAYRKAIINFTRALDSHSKSAIDRAITEKNKSALTLARILGCDVDDQEYMDEVCSL